MIYSYLQQHHKSMTTESEETLINHLYILQTITNIVDYASYFFIGLVR
jgi:hypothetical protein